MSPPPASLLDTIDALREADGTRPREAYFFVLAALGHAAEQLPAERRADPDRRHLHGHELLQGVVDLARSEFGPLAVTVFREWGVTCGEIEADHWAQVGWALGFDAPEFYESVVTDLIERGL